MASRDLGTYQMLWDCAFCGSEKLLGLTHRHCPGCGSPQDPSRRYFPSEADKVAVEDHRFTGVDKVCPNCQTPNGAAASHCGNCGSPLDGSKEVERAATRDASSEAGKSLEAEKRAQKRAAAMPPQEPPKKKGRGCMILVVLAIGAVIATALCMGLWKREATLSVSGHRWERSIAVERFGPVSDSAWCDSMPGGAYNVSQTEKERSTRKVEDGEECTTKQVDNGDGSFKEVEDCRTKYRSEPVYDQWCSYTIDKWSKARSEDASGKNLNPAWPEVRLGRTGQCDGCEREGARSAKYIVTLTDPKGDTQTCDLPEAKWKSMADGSRWKGEIRVLTGGLDCDALTPAK